jgi:hypothetical protein
VKYRGGGKGPYQAQSIAGDIDEGVHRMCFKRLARLLFGVVDDCCALREARRKGPGSIAPLSATPAPSSLSTSGTLEVETVVMTWDAPRASLAS